VPKLRIPGVPGGDAPAGGLLNGSRAAGKDATMPLSTGEIDTVMAEAFGPLPVPKWWAGLELDGDLILWVVVEQDKLRHRRLHCLTIIREMLEELAEVPCCIHVLEKIPTNGKIRRSVKRIARRW
jgi:hypothetical protein